MNILNKVTLQSLLKNKTRTIVTIIGIMLSTALVCAVTTSLSSALNFGKESIIYYNGSWHGSVLDANTVICDEITSSDEIKNSTTAQVLGYAKKDVENIYHPYFRIFGGSSNFVKMLSVNITSGRAPENTQEIILPKFINKSDDSEKYQIGDTFTFEIGDRYFDGEKQGADAPANRYEYGELVLADEELRVRETRQYTVVGFYEADSLTYADSSADIALTVQDDAPTGEYMYRIYYELKKPKQTYDFSKKYIDAGWTVDYNSELLLLSGVTLYKGIFNMIYALLAVLIGLIMFGSVALIYNAFAISVSERTKQFGLLSSIGATKKQLRKMVSFEAFAVSVIGIPLGIFLGIAGIGVTLALLGDKLASVMNMPFKMTLSVAPWAIVLACIVAIVTVRISVWIPSRRATRYTAIEAIRQVGDIKAEKKPIKTPKIIYKLFGLPGIIAHKHFKRSKKRYRATIFSLFMSIVLFISASSFTDYLVRVASDGFYTEKYDVSASYTTDDPDEPNEMLEQILADSNTKEATYTITDYNSFSNIDEKYLTDKVKKFLKYTSESEIEIDLLFEFVRDETFIDLLDEYGLDHDEYFNKESPLGIVVENFNLINTETGRMESYDLFKGDVNEIKCSFVKDKEGYSFYDYREDGMCRYLDDDYDDSDGSQNISDYFLDVPASEALDSYTVRSGKRITEKPYFVGDTTFAMMIYPQSMREYAIGKQLASRDPESDKEDYTFYIISKNHSRSAEVLTDILRERGGHDYVYDYAADVEAQRNLILIVKVFAYGFIVLISLIAAANVFNTISTNISLRRREFAMLRSVGMSSKGFNKMMNFECVLYGTKALLLGLPVSAGVCWLIYRSIVEGMDTRFYIPWSAVAISVLSVFAVVFATMMYAMSKIKKDNPIDALKNENT